MIFFSKEKKIMIFFSWNWFFYKSAIFSVNLLSSWYTVHIFFSFFLSIFLRTFFIQYPRNKVFEQKICLFLWAKILSLDTYYNTYAFRNRICSGKFQVFVYFVMTTCVKLEKIQVVLDFWGNFWFLKIGQTVKNKINWQHWTNLHQLTKKDNFRSNYLIWRKKCGTSILFVP